MLAKLSALPDVLGKPATLHADQGYFSAENVTACREDRAADRRGSATASSRRSHDP
jgi:IS5 family transposase